MNKSNIKNTAIILAFSMVTINCFNGYSMKKELESLRSDYSNLQNSMSSRLQRMKSHYLLLKTILKRLSLSLQAMPLY